MPDKYITTKNIGIFSPRIPLRVALDLTYRCNNRCRHCWLWTKDGRNELTTKEIIALVDDARALGCREWAISGGEPMLRPDFPEIFDYITSQAKSYSLNTNGTLITEEIAQLMKRKGSKMVAIYGATAEVHDHVTRNPGSFDAVMHGFSLLKDAGAGFTVQVVPMKDNYHQMEQMIALAKSLSRTWRIGASWLFLSAGRDPARNAEIAAQRLPASTALELDQPSLGSESGGDGAHPACPAGDDRLFAACIAHRRDFHVDPYGMLSFCAFVKDPAMRYDLRRGSLREGWEQFIPSLAGKVCGGEEYRNNCGSCELRKDCRWCPVYGYLEHGRHSAKVEYLCEIAKESRSYRETRLRDYRRYFRIGGITIQVDSDLPFSPASYHPKMDCFRADGPGNDTVKIHHHFGMPDFPMEKRGAEVYQREPWTIYRKGNAWIYTIPSTRDTMAVDHIAVFSNDHSAGNIYNSIENEDIFRRGNMESLSLFSTDEILVARLLADRNGLIIHSCGVSLDGKGLLFVGHSGAGKTTAGSQAKACGQILCEDRNIIRYQDNGWKVYGTWSHATPPDVSCGPAPLKAVLFPEKSESNRLIRIEDRRECIHRLLACIVRPFVTKDWWEKVLATSENLVRDVPFYRMQFDLSGNIVSELKRL